MGAGRFAARQLPRRHQLLPALGSASSKVQTSLVQAFDEHGDGLVLRGHEFEWDAEKEGTNSPHLSEAHAERLVDLVSAGIRTRWGNRRSALSSIRARAIGPLKTRASAGAT